MSVLMTTITDVIKCVLTSMVSFKAEIYYLCKMNNYPLPKVYQGMYNPVTR